MSLNDIKIRDVGGKSAETRVYQTASGTTAINPGEPVMLTTIGTSQYAALMTDAKPIIGTDFFCGIAAKVATHTASVDGEVEVYVPSPNTVYRAKAKSAAAADTDAEIKALANKRTIIDLTASAFTVDTAAADGSTNGFILTGTGNKDTSEVDFKASVRATDLGF